MFAVIGVVLVVIGCGIVAGAFYLHEVSDEGSGQSDAARMMSGFIAMGGVAVGIVGGVILGLTLLGDRGGPMCRSRAGCGGCQRAIASSAIRPT